MIGIVADDITGANDIGIMYAKADYRTDVYPLELWHAEAAAGDLPDVLVLDTNSRLDSAEEAYRKVFAATKAVQAAGCDRFFNKTCSVFRGNVGAEFDAMLDALGASFAVIVLGFPKNGRTTIGGVHYVHGKLLEASEFRRDPVHPMTESNLISILQKQTKRTVDFVPIALIEQGPGALRAEIERMRERCSYLILDVRDQGSLRIIAEAVQDEPILCGSSALSEELAILSRSMHPGESRKAGMESGGFPRVPFDQAALGRPSGSVLCAAGSLMPQTAAQIEYAKRSGIAAFELDSLILLQVEGKETHLEQLIVQASAVLQAGRDVLVHASNDPDKVAETKRRASKLGTGNTDISRIVSDALSSVVAAISERTGQRKLLIAGGETSSAVCAALGVSGLRLLREIEPGLPSCLAIGGTPYELVLKSGSFGSESFFVKAIAHLKETIA
ncbi:four-carbon acid sugar kinase family protein [Paenibacillus sp. R14(2021)]|uniref:four-carbon acid sugar kinase family protein n=1 Tax=Paenibacillus sp. R14(2021) TaxID=2859228 RepID=UPI001C616322|nr:four-carbon acid sugar kinase family protein [Paenibacillus sp. R14(2021)]